MLGASPVGLQFAMRKLTPTNGIVITVPSWSWRIETPDLI